MEVWKDVVGFENKYQVSNLGRIKGLERMVKNKNGYRKINEYILSPTILDTGYLVVGIGRKTRHVHTIVAMAFLGHIPCRFERVINHIDFNKLNNSISNLEIVSNRENSNQKHIKSKSKYTGVSWSDKSNKWMSRIYVCGKRRYLGLFINEIDAHLAYQKELELLLITK